MKRSFVCAVALVVLTAACSAVAVWLNADTPIRYIRVSFQGKDYHVAWCLPDKGVTRKVVLCPVKMPVEEWLEQTPRGCVRAAVNGPLFNSDASVPFNEVGLGRNEWVADTRWSPCPVKRYCFAMGPSVSAQDEAEVAEMATKPLPPGASQDFYNVPESIRKRHRYGFCNIGLLATSKKGSARACPAEQSKWERMFPETNLARIALVWTEDGDFILVGAEKATWEDAARFVVEELPKLCPSGGACSIAGAAMLDGGSTAQFGWARHWPFGWLQKRVPIEQANENEIVPLIVGVETTAR